jgi:hypothetical protein
LIALSITTLPEASAFGTAIVAGHIDLSAAVLRQNIR